jgi:hypothetical protein
MVDGAYDGVVKGVNYIIHLASPIMLKGETKPEDYETTPVEPAVVGTVNILIKRDVITSSVVAIAPGEYIFEKDAPDGLVIGHESRLPSPSGPYPSDFHAYNASKVAALQATTAFVRDHKPTSDVVKTSTHLLSLAEMNL